MIADDPLGRGALLNSLEELFKSFGPGTKAFLAPSIGRTPVLEFQLTRSEDPPFIENRRSLATTELTSRRSATELDLSDDRHEQVLNKLAAHPLVRTIRPPVRLELAALPGSVPVGAPVTVSAPVEDADYPIAVSYTHLTLPTILLV